MKTIVIAAAFCAFAAFIPETKKKKIIFLATPLLPRA